MAVPHSALNMKLSTVPYQQAALAAPIGLMGLPVEVIDIVLGFAVTISSETDPILIDISNAHDFPEDHYSSSAQRYYQLSRRKWKAPPGQASESSPDHDSEKKPPRYTHRSSRLIQPPITRTCRLLRREGLKLFYTENVFMFCNSNRSSAGTLLLQWLESLFEHQIGAMGPVSTGLSDSAAADQDELAKSMQMSLSCTGFWRGSPLSDLKAEKFRAVLTAAGIGAYIHTDSGKVVWERSSNGEYGFRLLRVQSAGSDTERWLSFEYLNDLLEEMCGKEKRFFIVKIEAHVLDLAR